MEKEDEIELEKGIKDLNELVNKVPSFISRIIIISCLLLLIFAVVFLSFSYGSARVCKQVDGILDDSYVCHLDLQPKTEIDNTGKFNFQLCRQ